MENEISTGQYAKKWGLIYGLVTLVIALVPLILEVQAQWTGFLLIAVAIFCYVMATREFKRDNGGYMTFGEGFRICITAALIAGVLRSVVNYIYVKVIDPGVTDRIAQAMQDAWREQGMSEEQIEQMSGFSSGFSNPEIGLIVGIILVLLGGLIWGSIVSAINKNEAEEF
ncbi:MAG: DUF4199 domain-containing protein [Roseivirga sp.]|jgi:membrane protein YqaA with SNARE-associated domain|uniref:DUF4199 domain-containing protein n=1 Tax=Roseivirga sp. TaxID=1964215 RepID=UPI001B1505B0|nr:DUF4199 domain-containing protein [Roseivirga sp.]MBO6497478.1 DUF4199 domain-containing protein [Roseivirga sp.]